MRAGFLIPLILMGCSWVGGGDKETVSTRGSVCGDPAIAGTPVGRVPGRIAGCGVADAVRVHAVGGITLSQPAVMECGTARTLRRWIDSGLRPAVGGHGGGVAELKVAAHYACRTRNSQPGAKISEHGKGRAIDIAAFRLRDGGAISVESHWNSGREGRILRRLHRSACGPFGTVLGPESDRWHRDHFHFDTARNGGGAYCR
jgi:hypothetical protein